MAKVEVLAICMGMGRGWRGWEGEETCQEASLLASKRPPGEHLALGLTGSETRFFQGTESQIDLQRYEPFHAPKTDTINQKVSMWKCKEISTHPSLGTWRRPSNFLHGNWSL